MTWKAEENCKIAQTDTSNEIKEFITQVIKKQAAKEERAEKISRRKDSDYHAINNEIMRRLRLIEKAQETQVDKVAPPIQVTADSLAYQLGIPIPRIPRI